MNQCRATFHRFAACLASLLLGTGIASAQNIISFSFSGNGDVTPQSSYLDSTDLAGAPGVRTGNWNNLLSSADTTHPSTVVFDGIFGEVLVFIPRIFYPNRPAPISEYFLDVFYPGVREQGLGYGFFCLQEGFWCFGLFGVVIYMTIYSYIVYSIYLYFISHTNNDFSIIAYSLAYYTLVLISIRSGVVGNFKATIILMMPLILLRMAPNIKITVKKYGIFL